MSSFLKSLFFILCFSSLQVIPQNVIPNMQTFPPFDMTEKGWPVSCQGNAQTPIDIPAATSPLVTRTTNVMRILSNTYQPISGRSMENLQNKGFRMDASKRGTLQVMKNNITYQYNLIDMHVHYLSEHTFNKATSLIEMHLVHTKDTAFLEQQGITKDPDTNTLLVVGIMFNIDEMNKDNSFISRLNLDTLAPVTNVDFSPYVDNTKNFYHYNGGLTTPPCSETVNWIVMEKTETMSRRQLDLFKNFILPVYPYGNWRKEQKLNNRPVYYVQNSTHGSFATVSYILILLVIAFIF